MRVWAFVYLRGCEYHLTNESLAFPSALVFSLSGALSLSRARVLSRLLSLSPLLARSLSRSLSRVLSHSDDFARKSHR